MAVLGRTLEHLGVQMYKQRPAALAELVANAWDADAGRVWIEVPEGPVKSTSQITITDDGSGMTPDEVADLYLVLGRNRREATAARSSDALEGTSAAPGVEALRAKTNPSIFTSSSRKVMGRKGIGKLAGFGIANVVVLETWTTTEYTTITLDVGSLTLSAGDLKEVEIAGTVTPTPSDVVCPTGTKLTLKNLKHQTEINTDDLRRSLGRRFSDTVRGRMKMTVNDQEVIRPIIDSEMRVPQDGTLDIADVDDKSAVLYQYEFSKAVLSREMQGFVVLVHGKTAQAPPFFFNIEGTASGQHGLKYISGIIEADFLDEGTDSETDVISTDRQEIDWSSPATQPLKSWGEALTRKALIDYRDFRKAAAGERLRENSRVAEELKKLDPASRKRAEKLIGVVGLTEADNAREEELALGLIAAFQYQQFYDVIDQIESINADASPTELEALLSSLASWDGLEARSLLVIVKGRIQVIEKFHSMIVARTPETAPTKGADNMHDLVARFPWILDPEWQVYQEEQSLRKAVEGLDLQIEGGTDWRRRFDFLALGSDGGRILIEIKRNGRALTLDEFYNIDRYHDRLSEAFDEPVPTLLVCDQSQTASVQRKLLERQSWLTVKSWAEIYERCMRHYGHYQALLEHDNEAPGFHNKVMEVKSVREVFTSGSTYRGEGSRQRDGLGSSDVQYENPK